MTLTRPRSWRASRSAQEFDEQRPADWMAHTTGYLPNATLADLGAPPLALERMARAIAAHYRASESLWQPAVGAHAAL